MKKLKAISADQDVGTGGKRDPDGWLTTPQLRKRLGDKSPMTIWRYEHDPDLNFPKPIRINGRKHWRIREIEAFEESQAARENMKLPFNPPNCNVAVGLHEQAASDGEERACSAVTEGSVQTTEDAKRSIGAVEGFETAARHLSGVPRGPTNSSRNPKSRSGGRRDAFVRNSSG
jgi:predicted DNA-binding transcriptional regulator AlpA